MLDVAARLFGMRLFHEVRMEDVAAEAGVAKGTIYRHFRDKDELFLALLKRGAGQLHEQLQAADAPAAAPQARLTALMGAVIEFFDGQPHVLDLIQRAESLGRLRETWQPARDELTHRVGELLAEGQRRSDFAVADPETASLILLGGVRAVIRFGRRPRPPGLAGRVVETVLFGASLPAAARLAAHR
jgi:TetR/AcrR family fatty acid metabolism transcriptional regulator